MKYTQVPTDAFEKLQLNAGIFVNEFNPATGEANEITGATTGGFQFASNPTYTDFGEDVDNMPANTKQMKRLTSYDPTMSGTYLSVDPTRLKDLIATADIDTDDPTHIVPRGELAIDDFTDKWWVGDYSDKNTGEKAGFIAIHLMNVLNTAGFQLQSTKDGKGQFAFEYHAHYDIENIDKVPFEVYVAAGSTAAADTNS